MKQFYTLVIALCCYSLYGQSCPTNSSQPRVLLAGDSWAQFMWDDTTYNAVFDKLGIADKAMVSKSLGNNPGPGHNGPEYAISGSTAAEWANPDYSWIDNVIQEITNNPTIETVVLSIGGNDILAGKTGNGWYENMDTDVAGSEAALFKRVMDDTNVVINAVQEVHPNVEFLISSYDFPNMNTFVGGAIRGGLSYNANSPISDAGINQMMLAIEGFRINNLLNDKVFYDNSIGLSHYYYGDGTNAPGTLPFPSGESFGGNPEKPTIRSNFRNFLDPIHLAKGPYEYKMMNQTTAYFLPKFRKGVSKTVFSEGDTKDGWTTGTTTGTSEVRVGDSEANTSYKGILTFDTSTIPDNSILNAASLYIIRKGANGTNPFTAGLLGAVQIEVKNGTFGTINIENEDYNATADASNAGCFHGTVSANDYALRIDLNAAGLAAVNKTGVTQFRLSFSDTNANANYIDFNTGDAIPDDDVTTVSIADYVDSAKPFLDLEYEEILSTPTFDISNVKLYPNPVANDFIIAGLEADTYELQIVSVQGQVIKEINNYKPEQKVTIEALSNGFYFVKMTNSNELSNTIKILKTD